MLEGGWLGVGLSLFRQDLIGANDEGIGLVLRDGDRLGGGEFAGCGFGRPFWMSGGEGGFVHFRAQAGQGNAGSFEELAADGTGRGENNLHGEEVLCRSARSFMIEAAVSSTERRVTSISGQFLSAQIRFMLRISSVMWRGSA